MDDTRNITQNRQTDVDEQVGAAAPLKEHTKRGKENGEDELANITVDDVISSTSRFKVVKIRSWSRSKCQATMCRNGRGCQAQRSGDGTYDAVKAILRV